MSGQGFNVLIASYYIFSAVAMKFNYKNDNLINFPCFNWYFYAFQIFCGTLSKIDWIETMNNYWEINNGKVFDGIHERKLHKKNKPHEVGFLANTTLNFFMNFHQLKDDVYSIITMGTISSDLLNLRSRDKRK